MYKQMSKQCTRGGGVTTLNYTILHYTFGFFVYGVIQCSQTRYTKEAKV